MVFNKNPKYDLFTQALHILCAYNLETEKLRLKDFYKRTGIYYSNVSQNIRLLISHELIVKHDLYYSLTKKGKDYYVRIKGLI